MKKRCVLKSNTAKKKMKNKWKDDSTDDSIRNKRQKNNLHTKHKHYECKVSNFLRAKVQVHY